MSAAPLLTVKDLVIEFDTRQGRRRVVDRIGFSLGEGEVLGILGESGSGKTITTMAILGLVSGYPGVTGGSIEVRDGERQISLLEDLPTVIRERSNRSPRKDIRRWQRIMQRRMRPLWGRIMTAVFQNPRDSLDPLMTVGEQLAESVVLAEPSFDREKVRNVSLGWLDRVQLDNPIRVHGSYAHELSGGMCQRAMIAVAMARKPQILIADEPTTGLDTTVRAEIVELFKDLMAHRRDLIIGGRSMLYISHDVREVLHLADRVIVMRHGRIVESTTALALRSGEGQRDDYTAFLLAAADLRTGAAA